MKYFVLGALASGFMLYGMSMIYGATGSLDLSDIADAIGSGQISYLPLTFGLVFLVAGLAFKLGAVPFHMWVPDVYQGAPTAITLVLAAAPKLAAFAITLRLLVQGLGDLTADWQPRDFSPGPTVFAEWAIKGGIDGHTRRQVDAAAPSGRFMTDKPKG